MPRTALLLAGLLLLPSAAHAQASVQVRVDLPVVLPQLVVVSPGLQVVPDVDDEVFFYDGHYWVRRDRGWYRSKSHRSGWVLVGPKLVPAKLVGLPPGKYKRYKPAKHHHGHDDRGHGRGHDHHDHGKKKGKHKD